MGQKAHPRGLRLKINKTWLSRWYSKQEFAKNLNEDIEIRKYVSKKYVEAGISHIEIDRAAKQLVVKIHTAKPGDRKSVV